MQNSQGSFLQFSYFFFKKASAAQHGHPQSWLGGGEYLTAVIRVPNILKDFQSILVSKGSRETGLFNFLLVWNFCHFSFSSSCPQIHLVFHRRGNRVMGCHSRLHQSQWQSLLTQLNAGWLMESDTMSLTVLCHPEKSEETQVLEKHGWGLFLGKK